MNNTKRLSLSMSRSETIAGLIYFLLYLLALPTLLELLFGALGWDYNTYNGVTQFNFVYFTLNFLAVIGIFHKFLWNSLKKISKRFWGFVQAVILGWILYQAATWLVSMGILWLQPSLQNLNNSFFATQAARNFSLTIIGTVLMAPLAEECFFRGLLFQGLHRKNRILAYAVSTVCFALVHVVSYLPAYGPVNSLLILLQYMPAGIALAWAYEKADTIFAPILIHMLINAITMIQFR